MNNANHFVSSLTEKCRDKSLEEIFTILRDLVEDAQYPTVKEWRNQGGKVLGHFQVYFPEEIAHAAGMLPVKICGSQTDGVAVSQHFGSYLCSILKTSLGLALDKNIELDLFVGLPICDGARNLAGIWGRNFPYKSQILHLPQNPSSAAAPAFLRHEYQRLAQDIEKVTETPMSDEALRNSIKLYNHSRRLMFDIYQLRRTEPWKLSADESMALIAAAGFLLREEWVALAENLLPRIKARQAQQREKMRVVLEGGFCETPPFDFLQAVSRSCYVVDDDLFIGLRYLLEDVETEGDPLQNLADAYLFKSSYSAVQHDDDKPNEKMLLERVKNSNAEAVILASAKMCEPGLDEQVAYGKELDEKGIPYFISEFEENQTTFDDISIQLETFVENVMFD
ncbi:MAG: 2-hydroxyacyl-CoA dehydratase family protein [Porticoccaceae bacterium]|jgi:benzoyl-CoA reductase subunit C|nr:2-hydroxyacyl-CoA dehydratase family protein [Porticoccaceae bacterium]